MAAGFYLDGSVQTLMSRRHMNSDFPQGIDANMLWDLFLQFLADVINSFFYLYVRLSNSREGYSQVGGLPGPPFFVAGKNLFKA